MRRLFLLLLACVMLLTACGTASQTTDQIELWVVTEQTEGGGMNDQAQMLIERFQKVYPNVTIRLDILPSSEESRAGYLQKIRSEIMSGGGPDIYLLPTSPQMPPTDETFSTAYMESLFSIVPLQMYNGIFTDISEYYDADEALGKESLVTAVMDAGVMDGARYILPLRYTYDVLLVDLDAMEELGIDMEIFESGIDDLYALALELDDYKAAHAVNIAPSIGLVSQFVDYETGNVLMDAQELAALFDRYRQVSVLADEESHQDIGFYINSEWIIREPGYPGYACSTSSFIYTNKKSERIFTTSGYPFMRIGLEDAVDTAAAIKAQQKNIGMYPVRAADGSLVAEITYYGAVGSGCKHPELAYEFLRMFLSEEVQWEQYWPRTELTGMIEDGYPVRTRGSVEYFFKTIRTQIQKAHDANVKAKMMKYVPRQRKFLGESFTITDEDVPVFSCRIDEARFPVTTADGEYFSLHLTEITEEEEAQQMIDDLQWYILEG